MGAADAIKDRIDAVTRQAPNLVHEVLVLVNNGDTRGIL
jgi:hypothetical protein